MHPPAAKILPPPGDRSVIVVPQGAGAYQALRENRARLTTLSGTLAGRDFQPLRRETRSEVLAAAAAYGREYLPAGLPDPDPDAPLVMTGHQPEYFHAGVWFKNFLASVLAERASATAMHLIVDNDLCRAPQMRVPSRADQVPSLAVLPMDGPGAAMPYEERQVVDSGRWHAFGQRVAAAIQPLVANPLILEAWPDAVRAQQRHGNLGRALCESRHLLEHRRGLRTWELPVSQLCQSTGFVHFVAQLLLDLPRFHTVFHDELQRHRRAYRIRSHTHPAPALQREDDWWEAPFWLWTAADPRRQPLWVRSTGARFELRGSPPSSPYSAETVTLALDRADHMVPDLVQLAERGIKVRPRAITMTLFVRLFLCDLFIHGIGGALYDRLTDELIRSYFHVEPPAFMTATATYRLPMAREPAEPGALRRVDGQLRDLWYHPERYLDRSVREAEGVGALVGRKVELISQIPPRGQRRGWHEEMARINESLRGQVEPAARQLQARRSQVLADQRERAIMASREHPFCLFPKDGFCEELLDAARQMA